MTKRYLWAGTAVLCCLLLLLYARFLEKPEETGLTLYSFSRADVMAIEIEGEGKKLQLEKDAEGHWIAAGGTEKLDADKVSTLLDDWSEPRGSTVSLEEPPDWSRYGLEPPVKQLTITLSAGQQRQVRIGKKSPVGWSLYVRVVGDEHLYLVSNYRVNSFSTDPAYFKASPPSPSVQR